VKIEVFGESAPFFGNFPGISHIFMKCAHRRPALPKTLLGQCFFNGSGGSFSAQTPKVCHFWSFPALFLTFHEKREKAEKTRKCTFFTFWAESDPRGGGENHCLQLCFHVFLTLAAFPPKISFLVEVCTFSYFS